MKNISNTDTSWKKRCFYKKLVVLNWRKLSYFRSFLWLNLSFLVSHDALIILSEQHKEDIQERAYQCIWNGYMIFTQKLYNSTTLSMWVVYLCWLFINTKVSKNSVQFKDVIFYFRWNNVIRWSSHICKRFSLIL